MTIFEQIMQSMSVMGVAEYANMKADANECPSTRTIGQCAQYKNNHERSTACFFCWVHWLQEEV